MDQDQAKTNGHEVTAASLNMKELEFRAASIVLDRLMFARQHGLSFEDNRNMYTVLGYPTHIQTARYKARYLRGGLAGRIVDALPNATWRGGFELIEDEDPEKITPFEKAWIDLEKKFKLNMVLRRADKLAGLSTYAVLLIGAVGGDLGTQLPKGKPQDLLYFSPFLGGGLGGSLNENRVLSDGADATISKFDESPQSPRFGLPEFYQLKRVTITDPSFQKPVHWSRVIHIAEDLLDDEVQGQPALERVWNLLDDLDKVTGGGAEAFWLRANQGIQLDIDKDANLSEPEKTALREQADEYQHQIRRMLRTKGVTVTPLGSDVANFAAQTEAILTQIAGAKAIPKRILTGSEMGELASSQDRDNWRDQVNGRQTGHAEPNIVRPLVDRLVEYGYLPTPSKGPQQYQVRWSTIVTKTEAEKYDASKAMATINQTFGGTVFTDAEIREQVDKAPLSDEQLAEIAEQAAEKIAQAQAARGGQPEGDDEEDEGGQARPGRFPRAAAAKDALVGALQKALETGDQDAVLRLVGMVK